MSYLAQYCGLLEDFKGQRGAPAQRKRSSPSTAQHRHDGKRFGGLKDKRTTHQMLASSRLPEQYEAKEDGSLLGE